MDKNALKAVIVAHGDTQKDLADFLGISLNTLNNKINGKTEFKYSEMQGVIHKYDLTPLEMAEIFFAE